MPTLSARLAGLDTQAPKGDVPQTQSSNTSPAQAKSSFSSYRFKRSPFKELISDLSSLTFWDSSIQLVDVVACRSHNTGTRVRVAPPAHPFRKVLLQLSQGSACLGLCLNDDSLKTNTGTTLFG